MVVGIHLTDSPALMIMSLFSFTEPVTIQYSGNRKKMASAISRMTVMTKYGVIRCFLLVMSSPPLFRGAAVHDLELQGAEQGNDDRQDHAHGVGVAEVLGGAESDLI